MANSDVKITGKNTHSGRDAILAIMTGGLTLLGGASKPTYTVEIDGVERKITAKDKDELSDKINKGDWGKES